MPKDTVKGNAMPVDAAATFRRELAMAIDQEGEGEEQEHRFQWRLDELDSQLMGQTELDSQLMGQTDAEEPRLVFRAIENSSEIESRARLGEDYPRAMQLAHDRLALWLRKVGLDVLSAQPSAWAQRLMSAPELVSAELVGWARTERALEDLGAAASDRGGWEPWRLHLLEFPDETVAALRAYVGWCVSLRCDGHATSTRKVSRSLRLEREFAAVECAGLPRSKKETYAHQQQQAQQAALDESVSVASAEKFAQRVTAALRRKTIRRTSA